MSIELYTRYLEELPQTENLGRIMPYGWIDLPETLDMTFMTYAEMVKEFGREIANGINAFTISLRRLTAWERVGRSLTDEKERHSLLHEFVDGPVTLTLITPYVLRSRFIFATAHLSHQLNLLRQESWGEERLPPDGEIWFDAMDVQGQSWKRYPKLKTAAEKLGNKAFQSGTEDFRNAFTHRFSTRIGVGITNFVTRIFDQGTGRVTYGFGGTPPLDLSEIIALLVAEAEKAYAVFERFQDLVAEQTAYVTERQAEFAMRRADHAHD